MSLNSYDFVANILTFLFLVIFWGMENQCILVSFCYLCNLLLVLKYIQELTYVFVLLKGGYDKEEKAARAYDLAALKYWGPSTHINFTVCFFSRNLFIRMSLLMDNYESNFDFILCPSAKQL